VEARFGRCAYFIMIDTETMQFVGIENPNIALGSGAGIQSAQLMAERGVQAVLTGNCGPNAFQTFGAAGIQVVVGVSGIVKDAVARFKAGAFSSATTSNVASHFGMGTGAEAQTTNTMGMGGGMGRGMGGGGGRGMGRGMGMGGGMGAGMMGGPSMGTSGVSPAFQQPPGPMNRDQEIAQIDQAKCNGCGQCVEQCPNDAIALRNR
jgi:predicted Fe-Mo cluster-binding NifX family protein/NAD-dependent dihydropyrimidine dehydrogenase PreA subunit